MTITKNVWKAAALLLILCLVSTVMISGTYAKYTSTYAGKDTALVAKWNIVATGGGIGMQDGAAAADLNLFNHEYDTHMTQMDGDYIVAPGVAGQFTLQFSNSSDVDAQVTFQIAKTGTADVPILYSLTSPAGVTCTAGGLAATLGTVNVTQSGIATKTVYWQWPFTGNPGGDPADTALGKQSVTDNRSTYGLLITSTAVQVAPATE